MAFGTNYEDINDEEYGLVPEGVYEVVIKNAEEKETKSGKLHLNLTLVIRNDVEQKCKNRYLFLKYWKRREPSDEDKQVQDYSFKQIMRLCKSADIPNNKSYETILDLCKDLAGRTLNVTVEWEEYNAKEYENITWVNPSKFKECKHVFKEKDKEKNTPAANNSVVPKVIVPDGWTDITDGDVPF